MLRYRTEIGLFALAVVVVSLRIAALSWNAQPPVFDNRFETLNVARALAQTGRFENPFRTGPTGPTAHVAPVYPAVIAALYHLPVSWPTALTVLGILLVALTTAGLPLASYAFLGSRTPGIYAGLIAPFTLYATPQQEVQLSSLLLMAACISIALWPGNGWWTCGFAVLTNPANLIPLAVVSIGRPLKQIAIIGAGILLICLPWIFRNWMVLGSPAPIRDNFGIEVYVSNNDCAEATLTDNIFTGCLQSKHPTFSVVENARLRNEGEIPYNRERFRDAMSWARTHVRKFATLTGGRAIAYWFPSVDTEGPAALAVQIATAAAFFALGIRRTELRSRFFIAAGLAWLPYLFVQSDLRYRSGTLWMWLLFAGQAIEILVKHLREPDPAVPRMSGT